MSHLSYARAHAYRLCIVRTLVLALWVGLFSGWVAVAPVSADSFTWGGGSLFSDNWNDANNWNFFNGPPTVPVFFNGATDIFMTGSRATSNLEQEYIITGITFQSGISSIAITGSKLTIRGLGVNDIVNEDNSNHTFNNEVALASHSGGGGGGGIFTIRADTADIEFNGNVSMSGEVFNASDGLTIDVTGVNSDVFFDGGFTRTAGGVTRVRTTGAGQVHFRSNVSGIEELSIGGTGEVILGTGANLGFGMNVDIDASAQFDLNNINANIDVLTGSGDVDLGSGTLTFGESTDFTYDGTIFGTGGLTKNLSGVATLTASQTYTGLTSIDDGTLRLSGSGRISNSSDVSVFGPATFDLNGVSDTVDSIRGAGTIRLGGAILTVDETAGTRTFSGNILETGELQKNGAGILVLSGSNTFTLLDINAGTLRASSAGNLGTGTIELGSGTLNTTSSFTNARPILVNSFTSTINVNSGTTFTQTGVISGTLDLTKQGNGTLVLSASNTYTGDTKIFDGTLSLNGSNRISNSSDVVMIAGGTLALGSSSDTVRSLSGSGGSVTTTGSGRLTVSAPSGIFTWGGSISGTGGLTKSGNHTMLVSAFQSFSGSTLINDGLLQFTGNGDFSSASDISVASGATWDLNGLSDLVDSINGAGLIRLGGAALFVDENSGSTRTFSGVISEAGNFTKNGTHTLVLTGNNTYTGTTTMDGGVLRVASSSNLGSGSLIFDSGTLNTTGTFTNSRAVSINPADSAIFDVNASTTLTQSGNITGASTTTLVKNGTGTFRTTAQNGGTFSGDIVINGGTFDMGGGGDGLGNSTTVTVNSLGTFLVNNPEDIGGLDGSGSVVLNQTLRTGHDNASTTFSGVLSGTGLFGKRGTGTVTLTGNNIYTGQTDIDAGILRLSGGGRLSNLTDVDIAAGAIFDLNNVSDTIDALTGAGDVTLGAGSNTFTVGGNNGSGTFTGDITEAGTFVKIGSGTQTLSGVGSWTNGTQINGGTLRITGSATTILGTGSIQINGGTLETTVSDNNFKSIVLNAGGGTVDVNAGTTFSMFAGTKITGVGSLTKTDTGTLALTASNTYTGDTNINAGLLLYAGGFARLSDLTDVTVAGGADWDLSGNSDTVKSIAGAGDIMLGGATLTVNQNGGSTLFSGLLSEAGGLVKEGTHQLTLTGVNTYTGNTAINGGILQINADSGLGDASATLSFDGGRLQSFITNTIDRVTTLNAGGGTISPASIFGATTITMSGDISGSGGLTKVGFGANPNRLILSGTNTYQGGTFVNYDTLQVATNANLGANVSDVTLTGSTLNTTGSFTNLHAIVLAGSGGTINVNSFTTLTEFGGISGIGNLTKRGTGVLRLFAPVTHAGDTSINSGLLQLGSSELPDAFDVTVFSSAIWDLNGVSDTIDGLQGFGTVLLGGGTLTVGFDDGDGDFSGSIQEAGGFTKTGSGTQILSGANTYTATTTIDRGTLEITDDNSLGAASATLVFNEGKLRTLSTFTTGRTTTINTIGEFETAAGTTLTFSSPIAGGANADLVKSGTGTLVLTQPSTFGGLTEITQGTLRLTGGGLLANGGVDVFIGATFDTTDVSDTIGRLLGGGDVLLGTGTLTIGADNLGGTFSGVISGVGGAIVKVGTGTEVFSGINTYNAGTFINDGVLRISQNENLGMLGSLLSFDGGTLNTTTTFSMIRGTALEAGGGTFDVDAGTTLDAAGNITGAGSLTKIGGGTLVLSGFSTYLGGTNVNAGIVEISSAVNLGSTLGTLTLDNGTLHTTNNITTARPTILGPGSGTIDTDGSTSLNLTGVISGAGSLTKAGDGTLTPSATNTYLGNTVLTAGTLRVDSSQRLGDAGNSIIMTGGTLSTLATFTNARTVSLAPTANTIEVAIGTTFTQSGVMHNLIPIFPGALAKQGDGVLLLTAANSYTGPTTIGAGTLRLAGAGRLPDVTDVSVAIGALFDLNNVSDAIDALTGSGDVTLGSGTLTVGSDDGGGTFNGIISGTGGLVKIGTGTLTFRTKSVGMDVFPNTYTGGTAINGGTVNIEDDTNFGDPAGPLSFDNGTLVVQGMDASFNTMRLVTLNAGGGTLNIDDDGSMTFGGVIAGTGSLTKEGVGKVTLSANNTYTGNTIINQGLVQLQGGGSLPDASSVTVNAVAGAMTLGGLALNDIDDTIDGLDGNGDIDLGSGTLTVGSAGSGGNFGGTIEGTGGIAKTGAGMQTLSGNNIYTGGTAINGGTLAITANSNLGDPAGSLSFDGGTLMVDNTFSMARATTMNAGGGTLNVTGANTLTHSAVISGTGGLGKSNSGTLILSGINSYTGPTNITGGTLRLGGIERLANATAVSVSGGATFDLNNFNESVDAISGAGSVQLGSAQLVIGLNNGSGTYSGVLSGMGDLLKEGTGVQTLTGINTYNGATFVDRGTLILSGGGSIDQVTLVTGFNIGSDGTTTVDGGSTTWDLSGNLFVGFDGTGRMNINNGATVTVDGNVTVGGNGVPGTLSLGGGTLDNSAGSGITVTTGALQGQGTVIGDVFNQGTVAPGNSAGVLTLMGNYSQDVTGTFAVEIGGTDNSDLLNPDYDFFDISGTAGLAGELELALISGFTPDQADSFTILSSSALAGVFSNVVDGARLNLSAGGTGSFQVDYTTDSIILSDFSGSGASFAADFDNDGDVDGDDLIKWQGDYSLNGNSDADNDGDSDGGDFLAWQRQLGSGVLPLSSSQTVPEPTTLVLLAGFATFGLLNRRRQHSA